MNWPLFYDVLHAKCSSLAVPIEDMSLTFISNKLETTMTSQCHVTTASLKQALKEDKRGIFYPPVSQKVLRIHP